MYSHHDTDRYQVVQHYGRSHVFLHSPHVISTEVKLIGLDKAKHLNGEAGFIKARINNKGRYPVKLECKSHHILVKPKNLIFLSYCKAKTCKEILEDPNASAWELEQCSHFLATECGEQINEVLQCLSFSVLKRFQYLMDGKSRPKFDEDFAANGWISVINAFCGKDSHGTLDAARTLHLVQRGLLEIWLDLCQKHLNQKGALNNVKLLFRFFCQMFVNADLTREVLKNHIPLDLFKKMVLIAESLADAETQGLATQSVGFLIEFAARQFYIRQDLVDYFKERIVEEHDAGGNLTDKCITWTLHECVNVEAVREQIKKGRIFGAEDNSKYQQIVSEGVKNMQAKMEGTYACNNSV